MIVPEKLEKKGYTAHRRGDGKRQNELDRKKGLRAQLFYDLLDRRTVAVDRLFRFIDDIGNGM